jgi:hypothetical protein
MSEMRTQAETLRKRYAALRKKGVKDIKFVFGPLAGETTESVCGSINEFLDAVEREEYVEIPQLGNARRRMT